MRELGRREWLHRLFFFHFPSIIGVSHMLGWPVPLQEKGGLSADLSHGRVRAKAPDRCRQNVSPRMQKGGEIVGFESPMRQVAAGWARSHALLVHIQQELIVGADMDQEMQGRLFQFDYFSEWKTNASRSAPPGKVIHCAGQD